MKALEIKNLTKIYGNDVHALKGIDLNVERGDFFALLGPNGAGKSTTIGIISSLVNKNEGTISICGVDIDDNFPLAKSKLGVVNQEFNFSQFEKVQDVIMSQAGYYGVSPQVAAEKSELYLKKLGIWNKKDVFIRELSGGQKRRCLIRICLKNKFFLNFSRSSRASAGPTRAHTVPYGPIRSDFWSNFKRFGSTTEF